MQDSSFKVLEYDKIKRQLAEAAKSEAGRALCLELMPFSEREEAEEALRRTADAIAYNYYAGNLPLVDFEDPERILRHLEKGFTPDIRNLLDIMRLAKLTCDLRKRLPGADYHPPDLNIDDAESPDAASKAPPDDFSPLQAELEADQRDFLIYRRIYRLPRLKDVYDSLDNAIDNEDDLKDKASPELYRIRRRIEDAQRRGREALEKILQNKGAALQDSIVTLREGRFVLPIKSDRKSLVPGLVHGTSQSGATVFVEPFALVEMNNKIKELQQAESDEVVRILAALGAMVAERAEDIRAASREIAELDFLQAKALEARRMKAEIAQISDDKSLFLKQAVHPLLNPDTAVASDIRLGPEFNTLIITGPNTGGKTVSLKTCGLLSLMGLSGLAIPAEQGSKIPMWSKVLADIGDEQSIEQSLSTFSSHMTRIVTMCDQVDEDTLLLLDELGSGTDPSEGAALACALLDYFRERGASIMATTHYPELKAYALNTPGVINACCEFDLKSLSPTYRLLIGVPGVSNALAISKRLGLPESILKAADAGIDDQEAELARMVEAIENSYKKSREMQAEIAAFKADMQKTEAEFEAEKARLEKEKSEIAEKAQREAYETVSAAEEEMKRLIFELEETVRKAREEEQYRKTAAADSEVIKAAHAKRKKAKEKKHKLQEAIFKTAVPQELAAEDIETGEIYSSKPARFTGKALTKPNKKGKLVLQNGMIKLTVGLEGLYKGEIDFDADFDEKYIKDNEPKNKSAKKARLQERDRNLANLRFKHVSTISPELDLHGMRAEEALQIVDDYLDKALLAGLKYVYINHGKGTGTLRKVIRKYLKGKPYIKSYKNADEKDGGNGVTVVEFK